MGRRVYTRKTNRKLTGRRNTLHKVKKRGHVKHKVAKRKVRRNTLRRIKTMHKVRKSLRKNKKGGGRVRQKVRSILNSARALPTRLLSPGWRPPPKPDPQSTPVAIKAIQSEAKEEAKEEENQPTRKDMIQTYDKWVPTDPGWSDEHKSGDVETLRSLQSSYGEEKAMKVMEKLNKLEAEALANERAS